MDIGIGLPNVVSGTTGDQLVEWARRAESAGFSSLGTIDRIVYPNYESLIALSAAAAVTERIGLLTSVLLAPLRPAALLAKQAAGVDSISGGRLRLGIAVGGREDDYEVMGVDFHRRGRIFDDQLEEMEQVFHGAERGMGHPEIPEPARPAGPEIVIGGTADKAFERAARYGSGWIQGGGGPDPFKEALPKLERAWKDAGRDGEPRKMALSYYALGDDPQGQAERELGHYYGFLGEIANYIVQGAAKSPDAIKQMVSAYEQLGCDELVWFPTSGDPNQVDLLHASLR